MMLLSVVDHVTNDRIISEMQRVWKDVFVAYFRALSKHVPGKAEENHENLS
jgi:hypothetical protein